MPNAESNERVDLSLLVLFEAVMAARDVGRAADLSPSAVSHGLGRLRRLLNDPLFLKSPKGVAPTARALELNVRYCLSGVVEILTSAMNLKMPSN